MLQTKNNILETIRNVEPIVIVKPKANEIIRKKSCGTNDFNKSKSRCDTRRKTNSTWQIRRSKE